MNKSTVIIAALLTFSPISLVEAQTTSPSVNQLLDETNQLIIEAESQLEQSEEEGRKYQSDLDALFQKCMNGNNSACNEYNRRLKIQNQRLDRLIRQTDPNSSKNRSWSDSFCHPYCD